MIANYHSHTTLCGHAEGTPEAYVEAALARGLQVFGFSDHAPQYYPGNYQSTIRMQRHEFPMYCDTVRSLQEQYKNLQIPLGLEAEYYSGSFRELLLRSKDQGVTYLILGQHGIGDNGAGPYTGTATEDTELLQQYCKLVRDGMQTGCFTYIAHPELIHYVGDPKIYEHHMRGLCREAKSTNTPLEINLLGILEGRHYPNEAFWKIAAEENCSIVLGIDAHAPEHITDLEPEKKALEIIKNFDLHLLESPVLRTL